MNRSVQISFYGVEASWYFMWTLTLFRFVRLESLMVLRGALMLQELDMNSCSF